MQREETSSVLAVRNEFITNMLPSLWLIGLSIAAGVAGQTVLKLGVSGPNAMPLDTGGPLQLVLFIMRSPWVLGGLALYAVGALSWIVVLSRMDLSYAYPFLALNFVLVTLVSRLVLGESIPLLRWIGIGCICIGILLIARSALSQ